MIRGDTFPLNPDDYRTNSQGQVAGLGGANLRKILNDHGITQILTSEGGRTSRGSMGLMVHYMEFLNQWNESDPPIDLEAVENFWAEQIREFFRNQPFILPSDSSRTIAACLNTVFDQARERQKQNRGTMYLGTIIQHLVAAKLRTILPEGSLKVYGASVADASTDRAGDFVIGNTSIHCTTMPGTQLMEKCRRNIDAGLHPVIITMFERVNAALALAEDMELEGRVEVWDVQQFLSSNVYEHSLFNESKRNSTIACIIDEYNNIVQETESDPSLKIRFESPADTK